RLEFRRVLFRSLKRFGILALPVLPLWSLVAIRSPTLSTGRPPKRGTPRPPPRDRPAPAGGSADDVPREMDRDRADTEIRHREQFRAGPGGAAFGTAPLDPS